MKLISYKSHIGLLSVRYLAAFAGSGGGSLWLSQSKNLFVPQHLVVDVKHLHLSQSDFHMISDKNQCSCNLFQTMECTPVFYLRLRLHVSETMNYWVLSAIPSLHIFRNHQIHTLIIISQPVTRFAISYFSGAWKLISIHRNYRFFIIVKIINALKLLK